MTQYSARDAETIGHDLRVLHEDLQLPVSLLADVDSYLASARECVPTVRAQLDKSRSKDKSDADEALEEADIAIKRASHELDLAVNLLGVLTAKLAKQLQEAPQVHQLQEIGRLVKLDEHSLELLGVGLSVRLPSSHIYALVSGLLDGLDTYEGPARTQPTVEQEGV